RRGRGGRGACPVGRGGHAHVGHPRAGEVLVKYGVCRSSMAPVSNTGLRRRRVVRGRGALTTQGFRSTRTVITRRRLRPIAGYRALPPGGSASKRGATAPSVRNRTVRLRTSIGWEGREGRMSDVSGVRQDSFAGTTRRRSPASRAAETRPTTGHNRTQLARNE